MAAERRVQSVLSHLSPPGLLSPTAADAKSPVAAVCVAAAATAGTDPFQADIAAIAPLSSSVRQALTRQGPGWTRSFLDLPDATLYVHEQRKWAADRTTVVMVPDPPNTVAGSYDALLMTHVLPTWDVHLVAFDLPVPYMARARDVVPSSSASRPVLFALR
jgi:hypothetical protein